ncbi:restriction endonuclease subunit S [Glaesserella parasuis]|nr:restriction endonuclease subunit S [Glaesserella parasuis]
MMNKLKLTDREWKEFGIGDLFDIKIGKSIDGNKVNREIGKTAYITRKEQNNGLDGFIDYEKNFLNIDYPVLTIGNETAEPFVQCYPFFTGTKVNILKPKQELSVYVLSFIAVSLKQHKSKYSYSFTINSTRLRKQIILLPVNADGQPDWQFMEDFIKQKEEKQVTKLKNYYADKALELMISTGNLKNTEWREFSFSQVFVEIQRGKRLTKSNQQDGTMPYVSSTATNNGVDNFIDNSTNVRIFENCLTLANSGSVGSTFFHYYTFVASDHVTALILEKPNKYVYLFLSGIIKRLEEKYSFNREINDKRIQREKILLPVNEEGLPDWQFMENFMKQIEQDKITAVLNYYKKPFNNNNLRGGGVETYLLPKNTWSTFAIQDICDIYSGVRLTKQEMINGNLPFIGASDSNNGITAFIANTNASLDRNVLGVNYNGSVVENFYHPYECLFSDDVKRLKIKSERVGKYAYLFLKTVILKQKSKYQYGYKFNAERMKKQKILLPVNTDNQPDWENIERYMQQIELEKIVCYLKSKHYS